MERIEERRKELPRSKGGFERETETEMDCSAFSFLNYCWEIHELIIITNGNFNFNFSFFEIVFVEPRLLWLGFGNWTSFESELRL